MKIMSSYLVSYNQGTNNKNQNDQQSFGLIRCNGQELQAETKLLKLIKIINDLRNKQYYPIKNQSTNNILKFKNLDNDEAHLYRHKDGSSDSFELFSIKDGKIEFDPTGEDKKNQGLIAAIIQTFLKIPQ